MLEHEKPIFCKTTTRAEDHRSLTRPITNPYMMDVPQTQHVSFGFYLWMQRVLELTPRVIHLNYIIILQVNQPNKESILKN